ncbi:MAG: [Paraprevotella sp.]|nr:[FeFe] hydrogenase H-cluster maturation GTPase HydF [Paraprevotella sp.]
MQTQTPRDQRKYVGIFGRRNNGKSSLFNALCGQQVAIVSDVPGTTTDVVTKNMEWPEIGACVIMDTAGFDDDGALGALRVEQTRKATERIDVAVLVLSTSEEQYITEGVNVEALATEKQWMVEMKRCETPVVAVLNKADLLTQPALVAEEYRKALGCKVLALSARSAQGVGALLQAISGVLTEHEEITDLVGSLAQAGDVVVLVAPQDIQAPKGRLILPQVQTMRSLLDKGCTAMMCTTERLESTLAALSAPPRLIITDSQVFQTVAALCPPETKLTSFSILLARQKGDIQRYLQGAKVMMNLSAGARILIAEACAHVPQNEDIGRVKLPNLLRTRLHSDLQIDIVSGQDFPENLGSYDLVIHCGACMFTRQHVLRRLQRAAEQHVPVTNYGVALAALSGILSKVVFPEP